MNPDRHSSVKYQDHPPYTKLGLEPPHLFEYQIIRNTSIKRLIFHPLAAWVHTQDFETARLSLVQA